MDENLQGSIFVLDGSHSSEDLCEDGFVMKLGVKFAAGLHIFVEGQVDYFSLGCEEEFALFDFKLSDVAVEFEERGQDGLEGVMGLDGNEFFDDDVDVVGGLDGFVVVRVHFMAVLLEHIDIADEGLLLELGFIDHEDGDLSLVGGTSGEQVHVVLSGDDVSQNIVFYLFAFEVHGSNI